jgi:hypothetical protein
MLPMLNYDSKYILTLNIFKYDVNIILGYLYITISILPLYILTCWNVGHLLITALLVTLKGLPY